VTAAVVETATLRPSSGLHVSYRGWGPYGYVIKTPMRLNSRTFRIRNHNGAIESLSFSSQVEIRNQSAEAANVSSTADSRKSGEEGSASS
jgi:hypothetical protein